MDINVTFRHMEPAESLKNYAEEKVSKMKRYADSPIEAHVVLSVEKFRHIADVTMRVNGTMIKAVEETGDMYSAIDQVMDKIEKQTKRHLSKIKERRGENLRNEKGKATGETADEAGVSASEDQGMEIEEIVAKPMDVDEAAMQLDIAERDFLLFRNAKSEEINALYRRNDGKLVLIKPSN